MDAKTRTGTRTPEHEQRARHKRTRVDHCLVEATAIRTDTPNSFVTNCHLFAAVTATDDRSAYQHLSSLRAPRSAAGRWALCSAVAFLYSWYVALDLHGAALGRPFDGVVVDPSALASGLEVVALVVGAFFVVAVPHELLHGAVMRYFGGRPRYGIRTARFGIPYAYAETQTDYGRNQMVAILVAPIVVISVVGFALAVGLDARWPLVLLAANVAGSVGDCWMASRLLEYPECVRVGPPPADGGGNEGGDGDEDGAENRDEDGALAIYSRSAIPQSRSPARVVHSFLVGTVGTVVVLALALVVLVFASLAFDSGAVVLADGDGNWLLFRHEPTADRGVLIEVGHRVVAALGAVGGVLWLGVGRGLEAPR
ncbi:DUF3267 domain-containing protein [Natronosalvus rutilus]|uniref:DUF3267 domain-containing protein n=1 Tax=Natronosalvus rutilus TaxID=2953753 RepID=A0A9E7N7Z9_9EURY|nr:DUF3267 domain-containing protein [Natronosalvus rutilus]UTF53145.1 DUF3267 domain-containing protein [Natronosalvus rutilus]